MDWHTRITQARAAKNITKSELAKLVGVSPATVTMWENGRTKKIEGSNLIRVCDVLDIEPGWLLGEFGLHETVELIERANEMSYHQVLYEWPVVHLVADDSEKGYRKENEIELDQWSKFAFRKQWIWVNRLSINDLLAIRFKSLDMEPALAYGDILVVNTLDTEFQDGSIYAFFYEGQFTVRRMQRDAGEWWLTSDHVDQRRYARKVYRPEVARVVGKVILRQTEKV